MVIRFVCNNYPVFSCSLWLTFSATSFQSPFSPLLSPSFLFRPDFKHEYPMKCSWLSIVPGLAREVHGRRGKVQDFDSRNNNRSGRRRWVSHIKVTNTFFFLHSCPVSTMLRCEGCFLKFSSSTVIWIALGTAPTGSYSLVLQSVFFLPVSDKLLYNTQHPHRTHYYTRSHNTIDGGNTIPCEGVFFLKWCRRWRLIQVVLLRWRWQLIVSI